MGAITALPMADIVEQPASEATLDLPPVMSPKTLAEVLEVTPKTLERWRDAKTGPRALKLPGSSLIRYTRTDVLAWLGSCAEDAGE